MKAILPNNKYVAWRSPEELHEVGLQWLSELKFIKNEQHFLSDLILEYTMPVIASGQAYKKSSRLLKRLARGQKTTASLIKKMIQHQNELDILLDGVDQLQKEEQYKENHRNLMLEINTFFSDFKDLKQEIFDFITTIMKQSKQKRLLA